MLRRMTRTLLVAILLAACGGKSVPSTAPGQGSGVSDVVEPALPDVEFDKLDHDQRIQFMKTKVVPTMEPLFKQHDPKKFADFGCKTCHGEGADKGEYDMPNPALPKLNFNDMSEFKKEDIEWMGKDIKPTMAKLLKQPEMTKENPKGFGCLECHHTKG